MDRRIASPYVMPGVESVSNYLNIIDRVTRYVINTNGISLEDIKSKSRKREFADPRQICMYVLRRYTTMTTEYIGNYYNRDHTTVVHATKTITGYLEVDSVIRGKVNDIVNRLELKLVTNK